MRNETTFDRLVKWYIEGDNAVKLTPKETETLKRWENAFTYLRNWRNKRDAFGMLKKDFPDTSDATLYRDIQHSINFFGNVNKVQQDGLRYLLTEKLTDAMNIAFNKPQLDLKAVVAAAREIRLLNGLHKDTGDKIDYAKLGQHEYQVMLPPEMTPVLEKIYASTKPVNLNEISEKLRLNEYQYQPDIQDIEAEEL